MAKVRLTPQRNIGERALTIRGKRPSLARAFYLQERPGGVITASCFPRRSPRVASEAQLAARAFIKYSAYLYKITHPFVVNSYKDQSLGLWLQPRDIFTAALAGRLFSFTLPDGRVLYSVSAREDVTVSLDVIASRPGSLLVRKTDYWSGLLPGLTGDVLTISPSGVPEWVSPQGALASPGRIVFDGQSLAGIGQGGGNTLISHGRRAIRLIGTSVSAVRLATPGFSERHTVNIRLLCARTGSMGGNYFLSVTLRSWSNTSQLLETYTSEDALPALPVGSEGSFVFEFHRPYDHRRVVDTWEIVRHGARSEDSNNDELLLWLVDITKHLVDDE